VSVDGRTLEVQRWGDGLTDRAPIVLLHEGLGSIGTWRGFPAALADRTRRDIIAYSRFDHGRSDAAPRRRGIDFSEQEAGVVPIVLDALDIESAILYGHSDGGSIAIVAAARHPQRMHALVLQAAHVFVEDVSVASVAQTKIAYADSNLRERLTRYHDDVDLAFHSWADVWLDPAFRDWNLESYLPRIHCPVLVMQGLDDEYGTERQVEAIVRGVAGPSTAMLLAECGHRPHRDQRERVLDAVAAFVAAQSIDRPRARSGD
jgi:pimeloyl-ACP methyl ester carboxylesterase